MAPQQRLLLETTWQAIEDAGLTMPGLAGSNTGVYLGAGSTEYWDLLRSTDHHDMHAVMGSESSGMAAGRVAYHLDLRGPAMAIDATCATPLLSVHLATRALRSGEIDLAIVGGASLLLSPEMYFALSEAGMLSSFGRCRFGDQRADGYVRSEGAVVLVLKRTSDAVHDGDQAYATIVGTAVRGDGRTGGSLTSPGIASQEALLHAAYQDAGVSPGTVDFVEAHGPGTPVGDPVELAALASVLGKDRDPEQPCLVGSVKSNIGHLEGTAGFAGLLKAALALQHRRLPTTLHVTSPLELFGEPGCPLRLATECTQLDVGDRPILAGVSAFGLSGTNAHVVLAEIPRQARENTVDDRVAHLLPLSAKDSIALRELATDMADLLTTPDGSSLADVCHSAGVRRTHHERRAAVIGHTREELATGLAAVAAGHGESAVVSARPKVVFVFPGQGSQWPGMGRELLRSDRTFAEWLAKCDEAVFTELGWSPIEELTTGRELSTMDKVQPTLWAVEVALAATWRAWGIEPDLVIGHSMGEVAAAVTSGILTVAEGAAVICRRGRLLAEQRTLGAMWAVQLGEEAARSAIGRHADRVCVGVVNSQHSTVLSGDPAALAEVVESLRERGVFCGQVQVDYASHAPHVQPLCPQVEQSLAGLRPRTGQVPLHSTVLDEVVDGTGLDGRYWADNLRRPVRFASAIQSVLAEGGPVLFLEMSPHPVLHSAIEDGIEAAEVEALVVGSLQRDEPELAAMLSAVATAYVNGCDPDWARLTEGGRFVALPDYPWQRQRFWVGDSNEQRHSAPPVLEVTAPTLRLRACPPEPGTRPKLDRRRSDIIHRLASATDCVEDLLSRLSQLLGISTEGVDGSLPPTQLGLDSLFAGKLAYQLRSELHISINLRELLQATSIRELAELIHRRLPVRQRPVPEAVRITAGARAICAGARGVRYGHGFDCFGE